MSVNSLQILRSDKINRSAKPHCSGDIRCARFEFIRKRRVGGSLECDGFNHVTAPLPGRHRVEQRLLSIQNTNACWTKQFVPGEHIKVGVEFLHIRGIVSDPLGAIDQHLGTNGMRLLDDRTHIGHRAQGVR